VKRQVFDYEKHPLWDWAVETTNILRPVITKARLTKKLRHELCSELQVSETTLYTYIKKLKELPVPSSLLPKAKGQKNGSTRIPNSLEKVIDEVIQKHFLSTQKKPISECYRILVEQCINQDLHPPSKSTFTRRVRRLPKKRKDISRKGAATVRSKSSPATKNFNADRPMQFVQIDHTVGVIILVDSNTRQVLGRPIITFAIDVYTRLCTGFNIDLYGPNTENVAKTIVHICFDKNDERTVHSCEKPWPYLGVPECLHLDNAKEFRSDSLRRGAAEHSIKLEYIERFIGTINRKTEQIPGTTFANITDRGSYDSEKHAVMTLSEYKAFIFKFICDTYHHTPHTGLKGLTPVQKLRQAIDDGFLPKKPVKPVDEFWADFSTRKTRKIRREGIEYERIFYWSPDVQSWFDRGVNHVEVIPSRTDISRIHVIGPDKKLHTVFSKDQRLPNISRAEYLQYRSKIVARGEMASLTNTEIARRVTSEHQAIISARKETKRMRRSNEQRHLNRDVAVKKTHTRKKEKDTFNVSQFLEPSKTNK